MNYKVLLERYKLGKANEEEKQLIEQEIEKFEALDEYISEIMDMELDDRTEVSRIGMNDEETSKLKKSVNRRLRKVIFASVSIVVVLYIIVFYGVSGIVDRLNYDPTAVIQSEKKEYQSPDFYYDMQAYISLNMPGYLINSITFQEEKGFGNYELSYSLRDLFTDSDQRYFVNLSRGRLSNSIDGIYSTKSLFRIWDGFEKIKYNLPEDSVMGEISDHEIKQKNEETLRYLKELNPLSYISIKIVFDEDLTMEEFYNMMNEHPSLNFKWAGIRTVKPGNRWKEGQPMHLIGFNPNINYEQITNQSVDPQKYPFFNLSLYEILDGGMLSEAELKDAKIKAYETHFRSRLAYLGSRKEFVKIFDNNYYYKTEFYNKSLAYIDEHGVNTYGVLVFGAAEDLLKDINELPYYSLYMNDVLPAKPNIYHR